jgi:hypothetical protein
MKSFGLNRTGEVKGIYLTPVNRIVGIPLFLQRGQEFRESPKWVELWQKNGDGNMHLMRRWRKKSIGYIEYSDIPNTWVEPRALQKSE